ncbi:MAG: hypothetical protein K2P78_07150 [Gemmataceae bacterium]|nr:hypothetical protein [Gemmataceae bacterium]
MFEYCDDPPPADEPQNRPLRGGCRKDGEEFCRAKHTGRAARTGHPPGRGLRVALVPDGGVPVSAREVNDEGVTASTGRRR